ncbi:MAG: AsmA family protein [Proteobacteria bacterium]|nr:AsmA family protein [Pseudomonadota bacterium]
MVLSRRLLRRLAWTVVVLGALFGAYASLPLMIDANVWKPALVQAVKEATGRELVIDGRMRLRMFPWPRLSVQRVHFANAPGAVGAQMVEVRWVGASPSWWALLQGRLEVGRLILSHPVIVLETDADGVPNWQFRPGAGAMQPEGAPASGFHLAIGELRIVQGTISYTNPQTKQTFRATEVDVTASVGSLQGPLSIKGLATVNGVPLSVDLALGEPSEKGQDLSFLFQVLNGRLEFKGRIDGLRPDASFKGRLSATTGELTEFVGNIVRAIGRDSAFDSASIERFTFDGAVDITPTRVALDAFTLVAGSESASGRLALEVGGKVPSLKGEVSMPRFDLGRWLALLDQPGLFAWPLAAVPPAPVPPAPPPPAKGTVPTAQPPAAQPPATKPPAAAGPAPAAPPSVFSRFEASLRLDVAELAYRDGSARDVVAAIELHDGRLTVPELKASLPGGATLAASLKPDGQIDLSGPRLRDTLSWLGLDTRPVPADRMLAFAMTGHVIGVPVGLQVPDLALTVDGQKATGSAGLVLGPPPVLSVALQADQLDLDPYLPPAPTTPAPTAPAAAPRPAPAPAATKPAAAPPPAATTADKNAALVTLKARVGRLRLNQQTLRAIEADTALQAGVLKVNAVKVGDLLGGKIDARGSITALASQPRFDVSFTASFPDGDKVAAYAGLPWFANGHIGAASASGGLSGTADSLALRDVSVTMLGATARASGTLGLAPTFHFEFPSFGLQAADLGPLVAVASGQPAAGGLGALTVEGAFRGDAARAAFDGNLQVLGAPLSGTVEASLGPRPNVTAKLRVPAPLDLNAVMGLPSRAAAPGPAPAASQAPSQVPSQAPQQAAAPAAPAPAAAPGGDRPINVAALRALDASLALEAPAVQFDALKLDDLALEATLRNGRLTIGRFAAGAYGGSVDVAGTVDATREALAIDLKGNLRGVDLGQLLRGTAGRNSFGNEHLMLAVDGKVDITDLAIQGGGRSVDELRATLVGRGRIGGHLDTSVASGSLGMASFATGLGSIFSTELGFGSAMLAGFVNHQSALAGDLGLANEVVSLRKQTVRGKNALASIDGDFNLREGVTDTTVRLDVGATDTIDYVFTVKGPLASPVFATRGGTAKDAQPKDAQPKEPAPDPKK